MTAPLSEEQLAEYGGRAALRGAALTAWLNRNSPFPGMYAVQGAEAVLETDVPALLAEIDRVQRAYTADTADLKRRVAELEAERDELNAMVRSSNAAAVEARADRSAQYDDLVHALGRDGSSLEWSELVDLATGYMRRAEGLEAGASARVAELERERHETNEALSKVSVALRAGYGTALVEAAAEFEKRTAPTGERLVGKAAVLRFLRERAAALTGGVQ